MHAKISAVLTGAAVPHRVRCHADFPVPIRTPGEFAAQLGYEVSRITKTLLVRGLSGDCFAAVVLPADRKCDFRAVAALIGEKRAEVASASDLERLTGYPPRGVAPIGLHSMPVLIDERLFAYPTVLIGSGEVAVEIEIDPADLARIAGAVRAPVCLP